MVLIRAHDPFSGHETDVGTVQSVTVWPLDADGHVSGPPVHIPQDDPPAVGTTVPGDSAQRVQAALESMGLPVDARQPDPTPQKATQAPSADPPARAKRTRRPRRPRASAEDVAKAVREMDQ